MIQIIPIGGYGEVGKNMTLVRIDNEAVILDMGIHLPNYITFTEDQEIVNLNPEELRQAGAVPDDSIIQSKEEVKAIIPTHAHLDHIGAIPYLSNEYKCPIVCTRFTGEVIKIICKDEKIKLKNKIQTLNDNGKIHLTENIKIEFIRVTHSTPQTVIVAIHTKYGIILYANDWKFDNYPTIGKKPDYKRLKKLGKEHVLALITDSLYAYDARKMPGENIVRQMLKEVMLDTDSSGKAVIITTFASHLSRLKSILEFAQKMGRKPVFLGRSLSKYIEAGENIGLINFSKQAEITKFGRQIRRKVKQLLKDDISKYLLIVTGHQGEPQATLSKMTTGIIPFEFHPGDHVIFSCNTIPTEINQENRDQLEHELTKRGVRIFKNIHVSGHAAREDLRDLISYVQPDHIVPTHAEKDRMEHLKTLALEMGYSDNVIHIVENGKVIEL